MTYGGEAAPTVSASACNIDGVEQVCVSVCVCVRARALWGARACVLHVRSVELAADLPLNRTRTSPNILLYHTLMSLNTRRQLRIQVAADPSASLRDALAALDQRWSIALS